MTRTASLSSFVACAALTIALAAHGCGSDSSSSSGTDGGKGGAGSGGSGGGAGTGGSAGTGGTSGNDGSVATGGSSGQKDAATTSDGAAASDAAPNPKACQSGNTCSADCTRTCREGGFDGTLKCICNGGMLYCGGCVLPDAGAPGDGGHPACPTDPVGKVCDQITDTFCDIQTDAGAATECECRRKKNQTVWYCG